MAARTNHVVDNWRGSNPKRVIATAYNYAVGGEVSHEIALGILINRFGVEAVMGRPYLGAGEINRILEAETIVTLYRRKEASPDWAAWAASNPGQAEKLGRAMMAAVEEGLIEDG